MAYRLRVLAVVLPLAEQHEVLRHSDTRQTCVPLKLAVKQSLRLGFLHLQYRVCPDYYFAVVLKSRLFKVPNDVASEIIPSACAVAGLVPCKLLAVYRANAAVHQYPVQLRDKIVELLEELVLVLAIAHIPQIVRIDVQVCKRRAENFKVNALVRHLPCHLYTVSVVKRVALIHYFLHYTASLIHAGNLNSSFFRLSTNSRPRTASV